MDKQSAQCVDCTMHNGGKGKHGLWGAGQGYPTLCVSSTPCSPSYSAALSTRSRRATTQRQHVLSTQRAARAHAQGAGIYIEMTHTHIKMIHTHIHAPGHHRCILGRKLDLCTHPNRPVSPRGACWWHLLDSRCALLGCYHWWLGRNAWRRRRFDSSLCTEPHHTQEEPIMARERKRRTLDLKGRCVR